MKNAALIIIFLVVFVPSLLIRLYPVESESFQHDAIVSQLAAREGVTANAWDQGSVYQQRRYHPPLLSYIIIINNNIFGGDDFNARVFSMIAGALACFIVGLSIYRLTGERSAVPDGSELTFSSDGGGAGWAGAAFGGLMLCLLPVHLYISRTANWDAVYSFFSVTTLYALSRYLLNRRRRTLAAAGLSGLLSFLTCEIGLSLLPAFLAVLLVDAGRSSRARVLGRWGRMLGVVLIALVVLWPAGVFKLDILRTLQFRIFDSSVVARKLPWYGFYTKLFGQSAVYSIVMAAGLAAFITVWVRRSTKVSTRRRSIHAYLISMAPFLVYVLTVFALSLKQRLVYIHHIADMFAPLTVLAVSAIVVLSRSLKPAGRAAVVVLGVAVIALSALAAANDDPAVVGPQELPGLVGLSEFLEHHEGARAYYYYSYAVDYYLPDNTVEGGRGRFWTAAKISELKNEGYDLIISDYTMLNDDFPSIAALAASLSPEYELTETIHHLRTDEPVVWIFKRSSM
jgi:4-amino-4-deoxy-L-arabinose transferase-like glycosyltransferase